MIILREDFDSLVEIIDEFSINKAKTNKIIFNLNKNILSTENIKNTLSFDKMSSSEFMNKIKKIAENNLLNSLIEKEDLKNLDYKTRLGDLDFILGCLFLNQFKYQFMAYPSSSISKLGYSYKGKKLVGLQSIGNFSFIGIINKSQVGNKVFSIIYFDNDELKSYFPLFGNSFQNEKYSSKYDLNFDTIENDIVSNFLKNTLKIENNLFLENIKKATLFIKDEDALKVLKSLKDKYFMEEY